MPYFHEYPQYHAARRSLPSIWLTECDLWECGCGHAQPTEIRTRRGPGPHAEDPCEECGATMPICPTIIPNAWCCLSALPGCLPDSDGPVTGYFSSPAAALIDCLEVCDLPGDPAMVEALESSSYSDDPALPRLRRWIESP